MKAIYRFTWDCRRMGVLNGVFIAEKDTINKTLGKKIYFGEVLGKHSEIYGVLEEEDLEIISEDQDFIDKCITVFGDGTISGYNPLEYYDPENDEVDFDMSDNESDDEGEYGC